MTSDKPYDEPELSEVLTRLEDQVPPACIRTLEETHRVRYPVNTGDFSLLFRYKLLTETRESLKEYMDMTEELANRMVNHANDFITFDQFCDLLKTRELTYSRISRCMLHILLDIRAADLSLYKEAGGCQYARVLGFRKEGAKLMARIKRSSSIPLITKLTQTEGLSETAQKMLRQDMFASDLYESVITNKYKMPFVNEYCQQIVRV